MSIPVSISLEPTLAAENMHPKPVQGKQRIITIAALAVAVAVCVSFIARFLVYLIDFVTNLAFYGKFSIADATPWGHTLGAFVILIPAVGGVVVGLMALYGSKAIRGHGIPEAMEQILTNQSKIKPAITYLKPISSAIAIGTGGPFGAEGPIIATGGALGSTLGQLLKISHNERKVLLAAGAAAGMSAIFGSPIAAIFLAIELLLFEFSPRAIIPVALACITGAAGHHLLFGSKPVFEVSNVIMPASNSALLIYSIMGILLGLLSVAITKAVYYVEDLFEKLPIHWMWWPALGGLAVGAVGYFAPRTLGVGYENITAILSGSMTFRVVFSLCVFKFISWAIALGSGTSGGTLAPLLTIGGATGALLGSVCIHLFPQAGVTVTLAALVGMSAMFAGASRALLTSIVFALETTGQSAALLPLLAGCTASYFISFFLMENTIMTEKIARRGVKTPDSYAPDVLEQVTVGQVVKENKLAISEENTIEEVREWITTEEEHSHSYFIIVSNEGRFKGIVSSSNIFNAHHDTTQPVSTLIRRKSCSISIGSTLKAAVETMVRENVDVLPIITGEDRVAGILDYSDILSAYKPGMADNEKKNPSISLKRHTYKIMLRGQKLMNISRKKAEA